jgi:hypothetical protein
MQIKQPRELMMLQRIESLEASNVQKTSHIADLEARIRHLELKTYTKDEFSDGSHIDWFVWEPVESAHVCRFDFMRQIVPGDMYSTAEVMMPIHELHVPVARYGDVWRTIKFPQGMKLDVRGLLEKIYEFYQTPITVRDIADRKRDKDDYIIDVRKKLAKGERVVWADLIGCSGYLPGSNESTENRRHPFSCSGLVRFEAIKIEGNKIVLALGS